MNKLGLAIGILALGATTAACGDSGGSSGGSGGGGTGGGGTTGSTTATTGSTTATTGGGAATCVDFCADYIATCTTAPDWADAAACETECATWTQGTAGATSGDTLECRFYHVTAAAGDATVHCPHAGADGGGVCI